jgi:threonylcarbamoyladenosine tRNA methylthiotransferase MtaB
LGCRTNQYESQAYVDQLLALGYEQVQEGESADLCIVNTCTVTESADSASRHQIRQLARKNPDSQLVVTGCLAERLPQEIKAMPEVSLVVPNLDKHNLLSHVFPGEELPEFAIQHFAAHTRAFVKVQDGCDSYCSYCILPYVRGRSRSRSVSEIIREVEQLVANGYQEVVLTGINVGDFEIKGTPDQADLRLSDLIRLVDQIPGVKRLRVSSIDPDEVDEDLADAILNGKNTCHSMHIVLQSGSNVILKRMNRKYTREIFLETVERLLKQSPDFTFTTDVIVGFPGESERDFQDTLDIMNHVRFAKVHMFPFSPRERTRAALYPNQIPPPIMQERKHKVLHLSEQNAFNLRQQFIGREMDILTEGEGEISGHTDNFLAVCVPATLKPNTFVKVKLISNSPLGLIGEVVS